jgi:hypothetical protein
MRCSQDTDKSQFFMLTTLLGFRRRTWSLWTSEKSFIWFLNCKCAMTICTCNYHFSDGCHILLQSDWWRALWQNMWTWQVYWKRRCQHYESRSEGRWIPACTSSCSPRWRSKLIYNSVFRFRWHWTIMLIQTWSRKICSSKATTQMLSSQYAILGKKRTFLFTWHCISF